MSVLDLSEFEGEVIQIRFYFDTRDPLNNDYPGWFFDDVLVTAAGYVFLSVEPVQGTVLANESETLYVTFDATEVPVGDYDLDIEIFSNDPGEPEVIIPTHLHVTEFDRGDANGDGIINIADVVFLVNYLFTGGPAPEPMEAGDANCDGTVDIADAVYLVNYLFAGGPPPSC